MKREPDSIYRGYKIWYQPGIKRRPWRCEIPSNSDHYADKENLAGCKNLIDRRLAHQQRVRDGRRDDD